MKKLPKYLSNTFALVLVWGVFLVPNVFATTIYQQLTDSGSTFLITVAYNPN